MIPVLRLAGLGKRFPGVRALSGASLEVRPGEVHGLVGENGAGKSTLVKVVTGAHRPDCGLVELCGSALPLGDPVRVRHAGVAAVYQEFSLAPSLTVRENLFLGCEPTRLGLVDTRSERRRAREALSRLGVELDLDVPVRALSVASRQLVEIARAMLGEARLLILDEPTAALTPREADRLLELLGELKSRGLGLLFVSHRLDEVVRTCDRVTIMRDGRTLGTWPIGELDRSRLIERMVGRALGDEYPRSDRKPGAALLEVRGLRSGRVRDVSFTVAAGEILGIAGLAGAGRTETARLIFGADRPTAGEIRLDGRELRLRSPREAIEHGICLLTEDRQSQGLCLGLSSRDNFALPNLDHWSRRGWIDRTRETEAFSRQVESLGIRLSGPEQPARDLSGGNQQKLLVARWLERDARVLIFDEPTRGIDVGARHEMYLLLHRLAARGKAVVMISSDFPELLGMSDRVLVLCDGRVGGELREPALVTPEQVLALAVP